MGSRTWLVVVLTALFLCTTAEVCPADEEPGGGDGGTTGAGGDPGTGGELGTGGETGTGGEGGSVTMLCPLLEGTYTITGCPANSCTIDQEPNGCFIDVVCDTDTLTLRSMSFIDEDGSFFVEAGPGSCNLVGGDDGIVAGLCTAFLGLDSCNLTGTRN